MIWTATHSIAVFVRNFLFDSSEKNLLEILEIEKNAFHSHIFEDPSNDI